MHLRSYDPDTAGSCGAPASPTSSDSNASTAETLLPGGSPGPSGAPGGGEEAYGASSLLRARLAEDVVLTAPSPTRVLFPTAGGNIHAFTALSNCAVLDVLAPPYSPEDGRDCTYYEEQLPPELAGPNGAAAAAGALAAAAAAGGQLEVALRPIPQPADFAVYRGSYKGTRVVA
jgi:hypothetical protein